MKDNGTWKTSSQAKKVKKTCEYKHCNETFLTPYKTNRFCSVSCSRKETTRVKKEQRPDIKLTCNYRYCEKEFTTKLKTVRYCCKQCAAKEGREKNNDIRRKNEGVTKQYVIHNLDRIRHGRDINEVKHFSSKWLENAWNKVRHEYVKEIV